MLLYGWTSVLRQLSQIWKGSQACKIRNPFCQVPWSERGLPVERIKDPLTVLGGFTFFMYENLSCSCIYPPQTMRSPQTYSLSYGSKSETIISRTLNIYCLVNRTGLGRKKWGEQFLAESWCLFPVLESFKQLLFITLWVWDLILKPVAWNLVWRSLPNLILQL